MSRPKSNGIVELVDDGQGMDAVGWHCIDFHLFQFEEVDKSWEAYHSRLLAARSGNCPYKGRCPRYAKTIKKRDVQLELDLG